MALVSITTIHGQYPEGTVTVGYDYETTDLTVRKLWGRATFLSAWNVGIYHETQRALLWSGVVTTTEISKNLNPQQRIQGTLDAEGGFIVPVSIQVWR